MNRKERKQLRNRKHFFRNMVRRVTFVERRNLAQAIQGTVTHTVVTEAAKQQEIGRVRSGISRLLEMEREAEAEQQLRDKRSAAARKGAETRRLNREKLDQAFLSENKL